MRYETANNNWIYDGFYDVYISPKGRVADYPGSPFCGQVSAKELVVIKEQINQSEEVDQNPVSVQLTATVVRTLVIGDVTINWIRVP